MLTLVVLIPILGALFVGLAKAGHDRWVATVFAGIPLVFLVITWTRFDFDSDAMFQLTETATWVPTLGVGWRMGVDGISLAIATMSALVFVAAMVYPVDTKGRPSAYYAWMLFLEAVSLGLFLTTDLLVFYVFFDLSLVGMYFLIGRWGHGESQFAAMKFFVYTLAGSLVMLLGILALYTATDPLTFDMEELINQQPLAGNTVRGGIALLLIVLGLAVKTPLFPVHTWLPPAHVNAPGPVSAILAGVLLKMGTYGLIRIPFSMMRESFERFALVIAIVGVVSILYGSLVALGQTDFKRRIAYTSVNHMGYSVLGIAAAGAFASGNDSARSLALTGATVEMVAHGLITGSLFLMAGSFWQRTQSYVMDEYGGLSASAPKLATAGVVAAFASLGLPGLVGFVAEFQIFVGVFAVFPVLAGIGLIGIVITAVLFLQMLQKIFFGEPAGRSLSFTDLGNAEVMVLVVLLGLVVFLGIYPRWLLTLIDHTAAVLVGAA